MKLSDIKGERVFDVLADLIEPVANISQDPDASDLFSRQKLPDGMEAKAFLLARVRKSLPKLLKGHKADLIAIMAAIGGVTPEEYSASLDMGKLLRDFIELLTDEVFLGLFT